MLLPEPGASFQMCCPFALLVLPSLAAPLLLLQFYRLYALLSMAVGFQRAVKLTGALLNPPFPCVLQPSHTSWPGGQPHVWSWATGHLHASQSLLLRQLSDSLTGHHHTELFA